MSAHATLETKPSTHKLLGDTLDPNHNSWSLLLETLNLFEKKSDDKQKCRIRLLKFGS
jgi:hypothetical protein